MRRILASPVIARNEVKLTAYAEPPTLLDAPQIRADLTRAALLFRGGGLRVAGLFFVRARRESSSVARTANRDEIRSRSLAARFINYIYSRGASYAIEVWERPKVDVKIRCR